MFSSLKYPTALLVIAAASCGFAQTVTAPSGGTANTLPVFTGGTTLGNSNIVQVNGNVGIGTGAPAAPISVSGVGTAQTGFVAAGDISGSSTERVRLSLGNMNASGSHSTAIGLYGRNGSGVQTEFEIGTDLNYSGGQSLYIWDGHSGNFPLYVDGNDNVGLGTVSPAARLEVSGNVIADGTITVKGQGGVTFSDGTVQSTAFTGVVCGGDYAESVDVSGDRTHYEPGDLLVIDASTEGKFLKSAEPYSTAVTGIYSTKPGVIGRRQLTDRANMKDEVPMAMTGIVPTKVTAENGAIKPGDLLVTSSKLGYAMKGTDRGLMLGAVIGKALGHLDEGTGVIEVVVTLQ